MFTYMATSLKAAGEQNALHSSKQLLHIARPKLIKQCQAQNVSIHGTKKELVCRLVQSKSKSVNTASTTKRKRKPKSKKGKRKATRRKKVTPQHPTPNKRLHELSQHFAAAQSSVTATETPKETLSPPKPKRTETQTPTHKFIYCITELTERPFLNDKHCQIVSTIDSSHVRVSLTNNASEHIVANANLITVTAKHKRRSAVDVSIASFTNTDNGNDSLKSPIQIAHSPIFTDLDLSADDLDAYLSMEGSVEPPALLSPSPPTILSDTDAEGTDVDAESVDTRSECESALTSHAYSENVKVNVIGVGVFVRYQMILSLFVGDDTHSQCLFGSALHSFRSECITFLYELECADQIDNDDRGVKHIATLTLSHFVCNDKQIIVVTSDDCSDTAHQRDGHRVFANGMRAIDAAMSALSDGYPSMPSALDTVRALFDKCDKHSFGELNEKEFGRFLRALTADDSINRASINALFGNADRKNRKAISFAQFCAYMERKKAPLWALLLELGGEYADVNLHSNSNTIQKIHNKQTIHLSSYNESQLSIHLAHGFSPGSHNSAIASIVHSSWAASFHSSRLAVSAGSRPTVGYSYLHIFHIFLKACFASCF